MKILDIYQKYQIMPQLVEHQFAVAAVARIICEHMTLTPTLSQRERGEIISACLLHDMGNIVKFDLRTTAKLFPGDFKEQSIEHWEKVKQEFIGKYGTGSHNVTAKIVKELGVGDQIFELVDCVGFEQGTDNAATDDFGKKICAYSDMRVKPAGVVSLDERMADLRVRYQNHPEGAPSREVFEASLRQIERQIFEYCDIKPEDITEQTIEGSKVKLRSFEISTGGI